MYPRLGNIVRHPAAGRTFPEKGRQELAVGRKSITEETMEILLKYSRGNIRELENVVKFDDYQR